MKKNSTYFQNFYVVEAPCIVVTDNFELYLNGGAEFRVFIVEKHLDCFIIVE